MSKLLYRLGRTCSVLVPLTAALMNLLSVAAAYGVLTAVFEKG